MNAGQETDAIPLLFDKSALILDIPVYGLFY